MDGIMGKKSKISFCPSSKRPNESAIEFDTVQFGASIVPGILGRGALAPDDASLLGMVTMFASLSVWMAGPAL
jgi:hypothetical protein